MKPWQVKSWCIPEVDYEYICRMEDVLDLYEKPFNEKNPVVCFDETPVQLIDDVLVPISAAPGRVKRRDYEYERKGTSNLFVFVQPLGGWREVKVTDQRTKKDFAECMKDLVDRHFPEADKIRVVMDNLNTHKLANLYEKFEPEEARRIIKKLEIHYTPKHASWLNMAEIEISVLGGQCLKRRIGSKEALEKEVAAYVLDRNSRRARILWGFNIPDARVKMKRLYP
ncbi:MAG: IS630 family transposase [Waddliaceae bacterium]